MIIIGLSGKKRSGKNTVAKLIATETPSLCKEFAFADALKDEVAKACGVKRSFLEENKQNFRLILQGWGTDFRRDLNDKQYWVKKLDSSLYEQFQKNPDCIALITDVRFVDEAEYLRKCGAVIVRVNRPTTSVDEHSSETDLDSYKFDFVIDNSSTLNNLAADVRRLLHNLKIPTKNKV